MIKYLLKFCQRIPGTTVTMDELGNLYITKGQSENYPCIVAHMDQVQDKYPKDYRVIETPELIFAYSPQKREQCGLGADDKNGIWIALKCLQKYDSLKVAFFIGEEIGCIGSSHCNMSFFDDCRFVLQCDRRGHDDLITSIWGDLCSQEFQDAIGYQQFGYSPTHGMTTDVGTLKENGLPISCINMSCGYYEPHSDQEFVDKKDLLNCLNFVEHIIENCTDVYPHEDFKYEGFYGYYGHSSKSSSPNIHDEDYDECYCEFYNVLFDNPDYSLTSLKNFFKDYYPSLSDGDYQEIFDAVKSELEPLQKQTTNKAI